MPKGNRRFLPCLIICFFLDKHLARKRIATLQMMIVAIERQISKICVPLISCFCERSPSKIALIFFTKAIFVFCPFDKRQIAVFSWGNKTISFAKLGFCPACTIIDWSEFTFHPAAYIIPSVAGTEVSPRCDFGMIILNI